MGRLAILAAFLALVQDDSGERHYAVLRDLLAAGRFVEARGLADGMLKKFKGTEWADKAGKFTSENGVYRITPIEPTGPDSNRLDVAIMADGVALDDKHQAQWDKEFEALLKSLLSSEVLHEYRRALNLYRFSVVSKEEKLNPTQGAQVTALNGREDDEITIDSFGTSRLARETGSRDDFAIVNVRPAGSTHGKSGAGMAIVGGPRPSKYRILHAWGHALAGLADESTQQLGPRRPDRPPEAPNVSDTDDPVKVPWKTWIAARVKGEKRAKQIDILEGAARMEKGAWRPVQDSLCVMNQGQDFCPVCRESVVLALYTWVRPIETSSLFERPIKAPAEISVVAFRPEHPLTVEWTVAATKDKAGSDAPVRDVLVSMSTRMGSGLLGPRTGPGPDWKPPAGEKKPGKQKPAGGDVIKDVFDTSTLAKGRWKVTVVVSDPTDWVARDAENLLKDWRSWIVDVE